MNFGNHIHKLRKKQNLSQEQLAEQVGVARQTISKWELGETSPDIKQAQALSQIFNVSLNELIGNDTPEDIISTEKTANENKGRPKNKKVIVLIAVFLCLCLTLTCVYSIINRLQILHPQGLDGDSVITKKEALLIGKGHAETIVFCESNKPTIACQLPEGFSADVERSGLYTDESGNYISFDAAYADNVVNPLLGTDYYSYYEGHGYQSYLDMARLAMYLNLSEINVFSSKEQIYLAGGAQLIRQQLCAGQHADYYEIDGGLTASGDEMRVYGFALHFENATWLITLKDFNDTYYFITIKDPNGIGETIDKVGVLLSTISITE